MAHPQRLRHEPQARRAKTVDLRSEALEAEVVIAVGANFAAIAEERAAALASGALVTGFSGLTTKT